MGMDTSEGSPSTNARLTIPSPYLKHTSPKTTALHCKTCYCDSTVRNDYRKAAVTVERHGCCYGEQTESDGEYEFLWREHRSLRRIAEASALCVFILWWVMILMFENRDPGREVWMKGMVPLSVASGVVVLPLLAWGCWWQGKQMKKLRVDGKRKRDLEAAIGTDGEQDKDGDGENEEEDDGESTGSERSVLEECKAEGQAVRI